MVPPTSRKVPRVSRYSGVRLLPSAFAYGAFTSYGRLSQNLSASFSLAFCGSITPQDFSFGLGSSDFARRYFRNRSFFLFLALLRWFSSGGSLCMTMDSSCSDGGSLRRVSPFRDPRITGYVLLPVAYRSLSRLSSALSAKAFTLCSLSLDLCVLVRTRRFPPSVAYSRPFFNFVSIASLCREFSMKLIFLFLMSFDLRYAVFKVLYIITRETRDIIKGEIPAATCSSIPSPA